MPAIEETPRSPHSGRTRLYRWVGILAVCVIVALGLSLFWPQPSLDPEDPATWPVDATKAVVFARGPGGRCPRNSLPAFITGDLWREAGQWQPSLAAANAASGILCLKTRGDLGALTKIGQGAEQAPSSALYLSRSRRGHGCPAGANYQTARECLSEAPLPPAADITP